MKKDKNYNWNINLCVFIDRLKKNVCSSSATGKTLLKTVDVIEKEMILTFENSIKCILPIDSNAFIKHYPYKNRYKVILKSKKGDLYFDEFRFPDRKREKNRLDGIFKELNLD